ncbi:MAG: LytTR family DNA-binding domain-containing protein, partial [Bacteroidota bacterium]
AIILTTAHREYALDSYDLDIIDYLLKPIAFDRFLKAVDRYRERKMTAVARTPLASTVSNPSDHIFFNVNRTHHKVLFNNILYVESLKDYVRIHTTKDRLVVKGNLGTIVKQLPEQQFIRIHRSFAIAIHFINAYNQNEVTINGNKLPIGVSYREAFLQQMG